MNEKYAEVGKVFEKISADTKDQRETFERALAAPKQPPYPFCCHAEKCIAAGRCERTVKGERWCCAD